MSDPRPRLCGPLTRELASMTREELAEEQREADARIEGAYWHFTRTSSPRVGPPSQDLYIRRSWAREAIRRVRDEDLATLHAAMERP